MIKIHRRDLAKTSRHRLHAHPADRVPQSDMLVLGPVLSAGSPFAQCWTHPEAMTFPVGSNATQSVLCPWPENVRSCLPASTSHERSILS
jgi:hypothetical protein